MIIVETDVLHIEWLATERVVKKTATGFVLSEVLRPSYEAMLAFVERHRATKIFSDNRQMWPTGREDLEWIEKEWLPRMLRAGWRTWAVLEPATSLGAMNVRRWIALYRAHGVSVQTFQSEEAALAWLREQPDAAAPDPAAAAARPVSA